MAKVDGRYTIALEWCGQARRRWVTRFCGEWVGQRGSRPAARALRDGHAATRLAGLAG